MLLRLGELALRLTITLALTGLMLVPTGVCLCAGHAEEAAPEEHQPGCPEVRQLDRSAAPVHYAGDLTPAAPIASVDDTRPAGPPRLVPELSHGPPRGQPIYLTLQTLLI
jgi:hypothetical protein